MEITNETIKRHERDIAEIKAEQKQLMKKWAELQRELVVKAQQNREMKGRE